MSHYRTSVVYCDADECTAMVESRAALIADVLPLTRLRMAALESGWQARVNGGTTMVDFCPKHIGLAPPGDHVVMTL